MSEFQRWKPWFDHRKKSPTMVPETRPGKGYFAFSDVEDRLNEKNAYIDQLKTDLLEAKQMIDDLNGLIKQKNNELTEAKEIVRSLFAQSCEQDGKFDHLCVSAYENAQDALIEWGLINKNDCTRG